MASEALYLDDLYSFLEIEAEICSRPDAVATPRPIAQGFAFDTVSFRYPDAEHWALRGLHFELRAGEVRAIQSGSNCRPRPTAAAITGVG